jgi:hypothetical protein
MVRFFIIRVDQIQKHHRNEYHQIDDKFTACHTNCLMTRRRKMLCIIRAKACKRCGGDLSLECDIYGVYIECIQCGATWSKSDLALPTAREVEKSLKAVKAKRLATAVRRR